MTNAEKTTTASRKTKAKEPLWFKVLVDGKSCHGGSMDWSLPVKQKNGKWKPGAWHTVDEPIQMYSTGLHLTKEPAKWAVDKARFYIAEYSGKHIIGNDDKIACQKVRLIREATIEELESVNVFFIGTHEIKDGINAVYGGTIECVYGGTIECVSGGTIKYVYGGTIKYVYGGTIESVSGGTIESVSGGTIKYVSGGTIKYVSGGTTISDCRKMPVKFDGYCVLIDRSQNPPKIICGWDKKGGAK